MVIRFNEDNKKTWTSFVYVLEVSPNTLAAYSSKSPRRTDVSILTFTLAALYILAKFQEQDSSGRFFVYYVLASFVYSIGELY